MNYAYDAILIGVVGMLTAAVTRETQKMRDYAKANPVPAMLEGADIVAYKAIEASSKGSSGSDKSPPAAYPGMNLETVTNPEKGGA